VLKEAFQDLNRLRQIATIVARHGFGAYLERSRLGGMLRRETEAGAAEAKSSESAPPPDESGRKTAARFRQMLLELGPTFVKLGQLLSSRPDILPSHWVEELSKLQDACEPLPYSEIREQIETSLGKSVESLFAEIDPAPVASASIAQVHRAKTHQGELVAVKVQRPNLRQGIESDLGLLRYLAQILEAVIEETGIYTPTGIIDEFDRAIHEELDFTNEARNAKAMAAASAKRDFLVIPQVHDDLSSSTVLTLDFVEGVKVTEVTVAAGYDPEQVAKHIIDASFKQLFEDGLFHGDPHPGNVRVLPDNRIALLDFGLVGRLTRPMQEALVTLIIAVALRDPETVARVLYRVGVPEGHTPITEFRADIAGLLDRYLGLRLDEIRAVTLLQDLLDLALRHKIKVPKEYALLSKSAMAVEGMVRRLHPKLDVLGVGLPYAKHLLLARFNLSDAGSVLLKALLKIQGLTEDVPVQLSQILMDLEGGKFRVNVHSEQLERIAVNVRAVGMMLFLGLMAGGLATGGLVALSWRLPGSTALTGIAIAALILASLVFGGAVALYFAGYARKISLRRWLRK
jgi:ubiquinone biosynthesis protein